jgi:hypothetical protein
LGYVVQVVPQRTEAVEWPKPLSNNRAICESYVDVRPSRLIPYYNSEDYYSENRGLLQIGNKVEKLRLRFYVNKKGYVRINVTSNRIRVAIVTVE